MICNVALMAPDGETQLSLIKVPLKGSKYSESPSNSLNDLMTATGSSISHSTVSTSTPSTASTTTTSIPSQHSTIGSSHPYHSSSSSSSSSSHQQHVASSSVITAAGHPLDSIDENTINRSSIVNTPNSSGSRLPPPYTNTSTPNSLNASSLSKDHPQQRERRRSSQMTSSTTTPTSSTISSSGSSGSLPSDPYSQSILVKSISKNDKFQDALLGTLISTCHLIRDVNSSKAAMFVFWDLAIRAEGRFRLTFTVSQISTTAYVNRKSLQREEAYIT